ncbi:valine--tRNA ligase [Candidatus Woesearchaeota archaeon]|nr:hypothetical protein [uncultured archaeon]MBS3167300.1 valine--tRNA ligase [Candidatus Woesearchaeota archaeon]
MSDLGDYKQEIEQKWQKYWIDKKLYKFDPKSKKPIYSIDTPPPTVSGAMHIGHAFSYSQQDFIVRYKRMNNFNIFYPFGTDDNGLPTERMVEKMKSVKSTKMSRKDFVELCRNTLKEIKQDFINNWIYIGMSCDFSNPYSTIDAHSIKTSQKSFIELYKKGLVYKKAAPSIWCVNCQTAIAQAELEDKELSSTFNEIEFKLKDNKTITISTTRPELLPACVCIFVNPSDKRYKSLIGKKAIVPIFEQEVEIFADPSADINKGTGILMICSYGDRFDVDAIQKKNLKPRVCLTKEGKLNSLAKQFEGLSIRDARKVILEELENKNLLKSKKQITHNVNVHDKCGTEIEFLATEQWFINVIDNKEKFLKVGDKINWYPKSMKSRYDNWVKNLNWDWCISRQRHFGVPFPVWYKKDGSIVLADEKELPVDPLSDKPKGHKEELIPEKDVMDTWATSSVTPQIALNWAKDKGFENVDFDKMYPLSLRPQAHDIIRTWAFYTIVKGVYHNNKQPWNDIIISGNVSDPYGEKMSKSKGNVVYPNEVIKKYSADALRFWAAGSKLGEDLAYQEKDLVTGQKFITKFWNASKFSMMHLQDYKLQKPKKLEFMDKYLLSKLNELIKNCTDSFDAYEYSKVKSETENFFWHTLCDNYLEIIKDRLYNPDKRGKDARISAQYTLYTSLLSCLKLIAPIMPHFTEEIYQNYFTKQEKSISVHISQWPESDKKLINKDLEKVGDRFIEILSEVRQFKNKQQKSLKTPINLVLTKPDESLLKEVLEDLKAVTSTQNLSFGKELQISFA